MDQVFNMGVGMVLVVSPYYAESIQHQLAQWDVASWQIGHVRPGPGGVVWGASAASARGRACPAWFCLITATARPPATLRRLGSR